MASFTPHVSPAGSRRSAGWGLFWVSVATLFIELLLIRWIATEVRIFAYLQNTVLVVCFLGLGMGCFTSRRPFNLYRALVPLAALLLLLTLPPTLRIFAGVSELFSVIGDPLIWYEQQAGSLAETLGQVALGLILTFVMMLLIWSTFLPLGRLLGRLMDDHPRPVTAYTISVVGSLLGTWLFTLASALHLPPSAWFAAGMAFSLPLLSRATRARALELALVTVIVVTALFTGRAPDAVETIWSPYQKLVYHTSDNGEYVDHWLTVNNVDYQGLLNLSEDFLERHADVFPQQMIGYTQYDLPLLLHPQPNDVLLVGAGSGNDAAGAVRGGATNIIAVEIDPVIVELGRRYHPERPYDQPQVRVVTDDARSFFAATRDRYDLIVFGLLDSHTTHAMTNARLDHYVYTRESIHRARALLSPGGLICLTFEAQKPYIADRMARVLQEEFGRKPLILRIPMSSAGWGGVMFLSGDDQAMANVEHALSEDERLRSVVATWRDDLPYELSYSTPLATDDWPYLYLPEPSIPVLYYLLAGLLAVLFVTGAWIAGCGGIFRNWSRTHWHFFSLGAAFLLLEVQNISKACVALGNTWWVNAVIISGVLVMVLLANLTAARFPRLRIFPVGVALILVCAGLYFVDLAWFAGMGFAEKAVLVGALTTLPMYFAGIVFIRSFVATPLKGEALGANLVGALVGGILQSLTFLTGVKFLLIVVAAFYILALSTRSKP